MNLTIEYECLGCRQERRTNKHFCPVDMCSEKKHYGFCQKCQMHLMRFFERQFLYVPRRLRIEGENPQGRS